jgi:hypothetical protein
LNGDDSHTDNTDKDEGQGVFPTYETRVKETDSRCHEKDKSSASKKVGVGRSIKLWERTFSTVAHYFGKAVIK